MSGFFNSRRILAGAILITIGAGATGLFAQRGGATTATATSSAPASMPSTSTAPAPVMLDPNAPIAVIGGMPINNKAFYDILMQVGGMRVFQQVYDLVLVQHAMRISGVDYEGKDFNDKVTDELERTLKGLQITSSDPKKEVDHAMRLQVLDAALQRQGVTGAEFAIRMQTRAGLRALSAGKNNVTPTEALAAYDAENGERRSVHLIPVTDDKQAAAVKDLLKNKKTPEEACTELKLTQPANVTISFNATGIDKVRAAVFSMKEKEVSAMTELPTQAGTPQQYVIIVLDKIEADKRGGDNKYDDKKKEEYTKKVQDSKEEQWMANHMNTLRSDPSLQVVINDPFLAYQFALIRQQAQQQAAAATQAAANATAPAGASTSGPAATPPVAVPPATTRSGLGAIPAVPGTRNP